MTTVSSTTGSSTTISWISDTVSIIAYSELSEDTTSTVGSTTVSSDTSKTDDDSTTASATAVSDTTADSVASASVVTSLELVSVEVVVVVVSVVVVELDELFSELNNDDAVLFTDDTSTLTVTSALASELEDDELSSVVAVDE